MPVKWMLEAGFAAGGEMGTGARGAPVPKVGRGTKIKRPEYHRRASNRREGAVNSR
jgi:hypothetical protein